MSTIDQIVDLVRVDSRLLTWFHRARRRSALAQDARPVRDPRLRGDAPADAGRPRRAALLAWLGALADGRGARRRLACRGDPRVAGARLQPARGQPASRRASRSPSTGWPDDLTELPGVGRYTADAVRASRSATHVLPRDTNVLRVAGAHRPQLRPRVRPGADGPRRDDLPRARAALRRVPARRAVPVARSALRAAAQAGARSRARSGSGGHGRCGSSPSAARRSRARRRGCRTLERDGLVAVRRTGLGSGLAARRPARRGPRRGP